MASSHKDADVIIAGAGPGGLMTALALARKGRKVLVLDRRSQDSVGRSLRVSIEETVFAEAGLDPPEPPEQISAPLSREYISPDGETSLKLDNVPLVSVDLRALLSRMVAEAEDIGVEFIFESTVTGPLTAGDKIEGIVGSSADGRLLELSAPLTVDATGIAGALRHGLEKSFDMEIEIDPSDVINAWQESREIDRDAVMELVSNDRIRPQTNVCRTGFTSTFSLFSIYVDLDDDRVDINVALPHSSRYKTARQLCSEYVESHAWIRELISAGGGVIPVRRPLSSFVANGMACVGDAACQTFPMHGSGVGNSLAAGAILARAADRALETGDTSRHALWSYNVEYMQERGAAQANADLLRHFVLTMDQDELSVMFDTGIISEDGILGSLEGLPLKLPLSSIASSLPGIIIKPRLAARLALLGRDINKMLRLYSEYPDRHNPETFKEWQSETEEIFNKWKQKQPVL
jgi:flavin-dependent dehydrogenase